MKTSGSVRRRVLIAAVLVALFTLTGFLVLPPIVRSQLEKQLSTRLGREVTVERVRMNPYTLSVTVENLVIRERDGRTPFVSWRRLYVNFDVLSSLWGAWTLSDVALDGFIARGVVNPDRSLNVTDLLEKLTSASKATAPATSKAGRPFRIEHLQVTDAQVDLSDQSRPQPFVTKVGPVGFDLREFQTAGERGAPYRFEAVTEAGEKLAWEGTIRAAPFQSIGQVRIENIVLNKYAPYYAGFLQGEIASGTLSLSGRYVIDMAEKQRLLELEDGAVQLRRFALRERGVEAPAVELPAVDIAGIRADGIKSTATIGSVVVAGGSVRVRRDPQGNLNLLMLVPTAMGGTAEPASAGPSRAAAGGQRPNVVVEQLAVKDFAAEMIDLAVPRPARLALNGVQLSLKNLTLAERARMPVDLTFGWTPQGSVHVSGDLQLSPMAADLKIDTRGVAMLPLSPYVEQFLNAHLTQGAVSATLAAQVAVPPGRSPEATISGDVTLEKFGLVDAGQNEDLGGFGALTVHGLRAGITPELQVSMDELAVAAPYARVLVAPDNTLNLATLRKTAPKGGATLVPAPVTAIAVTPASTGTSAGPTNVAKIEIGKITVSDGDFRYIDHSLTPGVTMTVRQFGGTITGLSSTKPAKGDVDLKGLVDGAGPVAITGKLDPFGANPKVDLKVDVKNVDLVPLSPYSGKYAGYELARGKLVVDVKVAIDGKKLDSTNVVTLNHFTFGNAVQSPDATKLPVRLGLALLKDMDGNVVIDVPIQGRTDDPDFKVGRVVLRVVVNLLTKAAVSPFSLLGAAFGGGGDELAYQEFEPGGIELQAAEIKKLETMVKALSNRPGLSLDLQGSYDAAADAYALKRLKLAERIRRAVWERKRQADPNIDAPEKLELTPEDVAATTKVLFDQAFPPGTAFGTPVPPPPAVVAPPPAPAPGLVKRIVRAITFADRRADRKAAAEKARLDEDHKQAVAAAIAKGLPLDEMTARLAETMTIDDNDLQTLAQARAQRVRTYFVEVGKIAPERVFLAKAQADAAKQGRGPRVFLELE